MNRPTGGELYGGRSKRWSSGFAKETVVFGKVLPRCARSAVCRTGDAVLRHHRPMGSGTANDGGISWMTPDYSYTNKAYE